MQLKTKLMFIKADIMFLKNCKRQKLFPNFIQLKSANLNNNDRANRAVIKGKRMWLQYELQYLYRKMSCIEKEVYALHLKLIKNLSDYEYNQWHLFDCYATRVIQHKYTEKRKILNRKFEDLKRANKISSTTTFLQPEIIPDYVKNLSSEHFTDQELQLLNRGLNFSLPSPKLPVEDIVVDVETSLKSIVGPEKYTIRQEVKKVLLTTSRNGELNSKAKILQKTINSLKSKDCFYLKADKGNSLVVIDKSDYFERLELLLTQGPYKELTENPLSKMSQQVNNVRKAATKILGEFINWKLRVSNPIIPRMYALPKIHKPGRNMRPIISNINAPAYKIAKFLVDEFKKLEPFPGFSVKNQYEFVNNVKDFHIDEDDIMVSFDIKAMFDNIPVQKALVYLKRWLEPQLPKEKVELFVQMATVCMDQNCFLANGKFYKQETGTAMGNPLSPEIANIFISYLELELKKDIVFPRCWQRYVDDVFAIIKKHQLRRLMKLLNCTKNKPIEFTYEIEDNNKLPFLDLEVTRNPSTNRLEFNIYRKSTATIRYITNDSNHSYQHKRAAFNSLTYRLVNIPLNSSNYETELNNIKDIAIKNGYNPKMVDQLVRGHKRKKELRNISSLTPDNNSILRRSTITYYPELSQKIKRIFKRSNVELVEKSERKLCNLLGSTKDKVENLQKSGIYSLKCDNCELSYIGQTRRPILTRYKEHFGHITKNRPEKSSVADHVISTGHSVSLGGLSLLKQVNHTGRLDAFESFYIEKFKPDLMNIDAGPIQSYLFQIGQQ